jgi:hypothetical protein
MQSLSPIRRHRLRCAQQGPSARDPADWQAFEDWCREQRLVPLASSAANVAAFLTEGAKTLSAGLASPAADPVVSAILRAARHTATPRRPASLASATLARMAVRCPRDLAGTRGRALLLLAANGLIRAALVGLDVEHIRFTSVRFRRYVTGSIPRRRNSVLCFAKIDRWGTLEHHRLGTDAIRRILARRAATHQQIAQGVGAFIRMSRRPAATATQAAATKAEAAADALLAWLQTQPTRAASHREPTDPATERREPIAGRPATGLLVEPDPLFQPRQPDLSGAEASTPSQDPIRRERGSALRPGHTDWLYHRLRITGPAAVLAVSAAPLGVPEPSRGISTSATWRKICSICWWHPGAHRHAGIPCP